MRSIHTWKRDVGMISRYILSKIMRKKIKFVVGGTIFLTIVNYIFNIDMYMMATNFERFTYPLEVDVPKLLYSIKHGEEIAVKKLRQFSFGYKIKSRYKCMDRTRTSHERLRLVFVVKSSVSHAKLRRVIRKTWGWEKRFSDVPIRTVFVLGRSAGSIYTQSDIEEESTEFGDIVQGDFVDSYFNNTIKTMLSLRWAKEFCPNANVYAFIDDDYYVSTKNLLQYLRNPFDVIVTNPNPYKMYRNVRFFSGYVFPSSSPQRFRFSKWYISLKEYPFSRWPPYVTGGAFVLSYDALEDLITTSQFTESFRFDDVYLGILAKRADLALTHNDEFYYYEKSYGDFEGYKNVIASHGYGDPNKLAAVWHHLRSNGAA